MQFSPTRTAIIAIVALLGILFTIPSFLPQNVGGVNELGVGETADGKLTVTLSVEGVSERM